MEGEIVQLNYHLDIQLECVTISFIVTSMNSKYFQINLKCFWLDL